MFLVSTLLSCVSVAEYITLPKMHCAQWGLYHYLTRGINITRFTIIRHFNNLYGFLARFYS